jgi:ArsR family transcriptional regulator, arsenate/arsenite/antimonite-responsive transcriptional repressor
VTVSEKIRLMKALADRSRLMILNALTEKPQYVEELAERLDLSASTISFHLKKLEDADLVAPVKEQYYVIYHLKQDLLSMSILNLVQIDHSEKKNQDERMETYRRKILTTFMRYGKLVKIPVQRKKRRVILEEMAKRFEPGRRYSEKEVNLIIAEFHDDFCTLRREMICENIMDRAKGFYWLTWDPVPAE